jgi:non-homologous end joining protein Ku
MPVPCADGVLARTEFSTPGSRFRTRSKDVAFASLHTTCQTCINHRKYCAHHEIFVEQHELVKGYEYTKDQ